MKLQTPKLALQPQSQQSPQKNAIRIHSGRLKGLGLQLPPKSFTRPTKCILRESFFNTISHQIIDCTFVEGFGGSGSMGIEALSRGAREVIFYEINPYIAKILQCNLNKALTRLDSLNTENLAQNIAQASIIKESFFNSHKMLQHSKNPTLLYLDPPFFIHKGMQDLEQKCLDFIATLHNANVFLIAFEHISTANLPKNLGKYAKIRAKKFGKSTISYYCV